MFADQKIWIGRGEKDCFLLPKMANRHGLIAGASGTGKTTTLKVLAESFSAMGVPVFLSDIKGDLSGMCQSGSMNESLQKRLTKFGLDDYPFMSFPTCYWDIYGKMGHPIRTTVSEMGPTLLSRLMNLTDVQDTVLSAIFRIADEKGLLLIDMKDLKSMIQYVSANAAELSLEYGKMSSQTLSAILRNVMVLEDEGGDLFFAEPAIDIRDWMKTDVSGRGYINILDSTELFLNPTLYATFMLWLLDELFEELPEVGDPEKPRLVFFFDEAHLLFKDMPKALLNKLEQVVKLIRSKGVGVYFITQSPSDIPDSVLAQLSNRVQHALRAYTPREQKAVRVAAETFRANPEFDTAAVISELGTGEALISTLDEKGIPTVVEKALILPPQSLMSACSEEQRREVIALSEMGAKYDEIVDRESAYEELTAPEEEPAPAPQMSETPASAAYAAASAYTTTGYAMNFDPMTGQPLNPQAAYMATVPPMTASNAASGAAAGTSQAFQEKLMLQQARIDQQTQAKLLIEQQKAAAKAAAEAEKERQKQLRAEAEARRKEEEARKKEEEARKKEMQKLFGKATGSLSTSFGREIGKALARGLFGTANAKSGKNRKTSKY